MLSPSEPRPVTRSGQPAPDLDWSEVGADWRAERGAAVEAADAAIEGPVEGALLVAYRDALTAALGLWQADATRLRETRATVYALRSELAAARIELRGAA
jgi:hypothetical protein